MDLLFMGITDIVIVLLVVGFLILGAKKGILHKIVDLASTLVALIGSFFFCGQFRDTLINNKLIYPTIYNNINSNLNEKLGGVDPNITIESAIQQLGLPSFLTKFIDTNAIDVNAIINNISTALSTIVMSIISFVILFVGIIILAKLAKLLVHILRAGSKLFTILDGTLGLVAYGAFAIILVYVLLFVISLVMQIPGLEAFNQFMMVDMQLDTEKFRLSKYLYENNLIMNLFGLFF